MSAHPQLSKEDATEIVKYVVSISNVREEKPLPPTGEIILNEHLGNTEEGRYILSASYTDNGGAITPLTNKDVLVLRPSKVQVENADITYNLRKTDRNLSGINNGSYFVLKNIDLKDVANLTYRLSSLDKDGAVQVHVDNLKGQVISTLNYQSTGAWNKYVELNAPITNPGGKHNLYFVFVKPETPNKNIASLDWVNFEGGREVIAKPVVETQEKSKPKPPSHKKGVPQSAMPLTPERSIPGTNKKVTSSK
jgi:cytochrome c